MILEVGDIWKSGEGNSKLLNFSGNQFPHLQSGDDIVYEIRLLLRLK